MVTNKCLAGVAPYWLLNALMRAGIPHSVYHTTVIRQLALLLIDSNPHDHLSTKEVCKSAGLVHLFHWRHHPLYLNDLIIARSSQ